MANIRNQDSWVHSDTPEGATTKAMDLVRAAVARAIRLKPLIEKVVPVNPRGLVIGGGVAGMTAAKSLGDQGFEVVLVEREPELGGYARKLHRTIEGAKVRELLDRLIAEVSSHDKIQVLTQALVVAHSGYKGNFVTELLVGPGMYERKLTHGAVILATGAVQYEPTEFLYGRDERIMTQVELADRMEEGFGSEPVSVVMIQCVGSRNQEHPDCSRICCQSAIKNALHLKELNPENRVMILYRDMRTYGFMERYLHPGP